MILFSQELQNLNELMAKKVKRSLKALRHLVEQGKILDTVNNEVSESLIAVSTDSTAFILSKIANIIFWLPHLTCFTLYWIIYSIKLLHSDTDSSSFVSDDVPSVFADVRELSAHLGYLISELGQNLSAKLEEHLSGTNRHCFPSHIHIDCEGWYTWW